MIVDQLHSGIKDFLANSKAPQNLPRYSDSFIAPKQPNQTEPGNNNFEVLIDGLNMLRNRAMVLTALKHLCNIAKKILNKPALSHRRFVDKDDEVFRFELFELAEAKALLLAMGFKEEADYFYFDEKDTEGLAKAHASLTRKRYLLSQEQQPQQQSNPPPQQPQQPQPQPQRPQPQPQQQQSAGNNTTDGLQSLLKHFSTPEGMQQMNKMMGMLGTGQPSNMTNMMNMMGGLFGQNQQSPNTQPSHSQSQQQAHHNNNNTASASRNKQPSKLPVHAAVSAEATDLGQYDAALEQLSKQGFTDEKRNLFLLKQCRGDIDAVIQRLSS